MMEKKAILIIAVTTVWHLSIAAQTPGSSLFTSLQFTRDTLMTAMGFSPDSEHTVEELTPMKTTDDNNNRLTILHKVDSFGLKELKPKNPEQDRNSIIGHAKVFSLTAVDVSNSEDPLPTIKPWVHQKERKNHRPRTSPSNKFLEAINEIERAVANTRASGVRYSEATLTKLEGLLVRAIRSKSYKYAREVLGQIMYLLSTKSSPPGRRKRANEREGTDFLHGLRKQLGTSAFESFMAVKGEVSLIFVIDDTGSMTEEIQATKNIAKYIINYPRQAPVEYILSPFNDPYPDTNPVIVKDEAEAGEFETAIDNLKPHGGGDCPEYTFAGMLQALYEEPMWGSPMYVFTDAGPKDATDENIEEVKYLASPDEYGVTINFFTTGFCRSQGYSGNDPRNLHPAFKELAEQTSGQALLLKDDKELNKLKDLTGGALVGTTVLGFGVSSNKSGRKKRSVGGGGRYVIPVDESIEKMTVTVTTTRIDTKGNGITLTDPDNVIITYEKVSLSQISIYHIDKPKKGAWTLVVSSSNGEHEFYVKSTSRTNIDFEHYFIIPLSTRRRVTSEVPISNPVIGQSNKMVITVAGSEKLDTSTVSLELVTTQGARISDVALQTTDGVHFTASITPRSRQPFKFKLRGTTSGGNTFERISRQTIEPTTAVLRGKYASNDYTLPLGRTTFVHFQLCNFGTSEYFDVTVAKDKMGYMVTPSMRPRRVIKGRCITISVRARATRPQDVDKTDTVFLIAKGRTSKVTVSQAVRLFVVS